jgi:hypothetical protein
MGCCIIPIVAQRDRGGFAGREQFPLPLQLFDPGANYEAIIWPSRYVHLHRLSITVGVAAHMRALDRDMQYAARRLRRPLYLVRDPEC